MIDAEHAIAHNEVMVIDNEFVITGSFNFTKAAQEKNAENLLIIRDQGLATQYTQNWETHRQHSQPYVGRGVR
jgi:phosphatidylserine/phosphatidylglycerophosphate/cardiolipin synthase-like enzyme